MTRMERRRRRQKQIRRRIALIGAVLVATPIAISSMVTDARVDTSSRETTVQAENEMTERADDSLQQPTELVYKIKSSDFATEIEAEVSEDAVKEEKQKFLSDEIPLDHDLQCHLVDVCKEYRIPYEIALGVIQAESSFTADASNGSCFGYMQINEINADWLREDIGVTDLTDPYQNIRAGCYILSDLFADYGDWHKALVAYNCGPAGAQEHVFSKGQTTTQYSRTVMAYADEWVEVIWK